MDFGDKAADVAEPARGFECGGGVIGFGAEPGDNTAIVLVDEANVLDLSGAFGGAGLVDAERVDP